MARRRAKDKDDGSTATTEPPTNGKPAEDAAVTIETDKGHVPIDSPEGVNRVKQAIEAAAETKRKSEAFDKIASLNRETQAAFTVFTKADKDAKAKKKAWEAKVAELQSAIALAESPPPMPLFDKKPSANGEYHPADDSWKTVPLAEALEGVSEKVVEKLNAANLHTVGELAEYTAADGGRHRLSDVEGIGPATVEKIDAALETFWKRRKEAEAAKPAETAPEEDEAADEVEEDAGE